MVIVVAISIFINWRFTSTTHKFPLTMAFSRKWNPPVQLASQPITNDEIHTFFIHYSSSSFQIQPHKIMAVNLTHFFHSLVPSKSSNCFYSPRCGSSSSTLQIKLPLHCHCCPSLANKLNDAIRVWIYDFKSYLINYVYGDNKNTQHDFTSLGALESSLNSSEI